MEKMEADNVDTEVTRRSKEENANDDMETGDLEYDETAYIMYHRAQTESPCLSFDILADKLGEKREDFPLECYLVAGTQADRAQANCIIPIKLSNLCKTQKTGDSEDDSDSDSDSSESESTSTKPKFGHCRIHHMGTVNRIRASIVADKHLVATWSDTGRIHIWDLTTPVSNLDTTSSQTSASSQSPLFTFAGHQTEGYAVDWSSTDKGRLATGDCRHNIHLWEPRSDGSWHVDQRPYSAHTDSVEDIQWSPSEQNVFSSCSVDKSIRIWDARSPPSKACKISISDCHDSDVNVISWNQKEQQFIASGGDDGVIKVWDLRQYKASSSSGPVFTPVVSFRYHTGPITSLEWNPNDSSVLAVSGADDRITIWDFAVEAWTTSTSNSSQEEEVPAQLLFVHQGQKEIKELHWHKQLPGVIISTANDGFNIFRTISA